MSCRDPFVIIWKFDYLEKHSTQVVSTKLNSGANNNTTNIWLSPQGYFPHTAVCLFKEKTSQA